jgi:hypothetical protein
MRTYRSGRTTDLSFFTTSIRLLIPRLSGQPTGQIQDGEPDCDDNNTWHFINSGGHQRDPDPVCDNNNPDEKTEDFQDRLHSNTHLPSVPGDESPEQ